MLSFKYYFYSAPASCNYLKKLEIGIESYYNVKKKYADHILTEGK